ncbi:conserved unknown protein [Ectocarpus siliculosus]|uniref:NADH:ubiquinone oxidoreductase intermediate-associated protein 30 domain-containing protein n=1 Tax=Ectocarpus siliculosus TaxID=2880 RepID=D8LL63_ECTSI|nr:conserved unknown protein [Ectocarpus siliculosus]|eukprot:CBN79682.1 conserved unknown protein [Ectocarpus siliculosus]
MARNKSKALAMLTGGKETKGGSGLDVVVADIADKSSLTPSLFKDVAAVVSCTAAIVRPKEGDGPDRAKYFQGITFYEPEVADVPKETEFEGIYNLVEAASRYSDMKGKTLFACLPSFQEGWRQWGALDDVVMGGVSESGLGVVPGAGETDVSSSSGSPAAAAVFSGEVKTSNSGGFVSIRTRNASPPLDLSEYDALRLRVKGDGNRYKFSIYDSPGWNSKAWCDTFDTVKGEWIDVDIPFTTLKYNFRTESIKDPPPFSPNSINSFQLMLSKFELDGKLNPNFSAGPFELTIASIKAVSIETSEEMQNSRFVHLSSAGVTRPGRPDLDMDTEPPAVRMNEMLSHLLTYKLKGEDVIRDSGIPATIIRPCALTEEPAGAPMIVGQGDYLKGKISRDDIAELAVSSLLTPEASGLTFEVKSDLAFSTLWQGAPQGAPARSYGDILGPLEQGVTGKEWMGDRTPEEAQGVTAEVAPQET